MTTNLVLGQQQKESKPTHTIDSNDELPDHLLIDSGASQTLVRSAHYLHHATPNSEINIVDAQKQDIPINAIGNLHFNFQKASRAPLPSHGFSFLPSRVHSGALTSLPHLLGCAALKRSQFV